MTRSTNARIAGAAYLVYIGVAFPDMLLLNRATSGAGVAAKLANVAQHTTAMRIAIVLTLLSAFCAFALAVTMFAVTRDEDRDVAMLGLVCRVGEGVLGALPLTTLGLLWLATATGPRAPDAATQAALAPFLLELGRWKTIVGSLLFATGSTAFSYLLLRGRMVPVWLAWLGVLGSALLVVLLPAQLAGLVGSPVTDAMWLPVAVFEIVLAVWLIAKGVPEARAR